MTILSVEKILIFQQVCCYGNSYELPFVIKRCARAAPAWVWGSSAPRKHFAWQQLWSMGKGAGRAVSVPQELLQVTMVSNQVSFFFFFLLAQNSRSRCMKRWKTKSIICTGGRSLQKLDNSVFLLAAMFSFLVNRKLTSRHLVTWVRDASWRQCPPASTCPEGLIPHPRTAWPHSLH